MGKLRLGRFIGESRRGVSLFVFCFFVNCSCCVGVMFYTSAFCCLDIWVVVVGFRFGVF